MILIQCLYLQDNSRGDDAVCPRVLSEFAHYAAQHDASQEFFEEMLEESQGVLRIQNEFISFEHSVNEEMRCLREELSAVHHAHQCAGIPHIQSAPIHSAPQDEFKSSIVTLSSVPSTFVSDARSSSEHSNSRQYGVAEQLSTFSVNSKRKDGYPGFIVMNGMHHLLLAALPMPNTRPPLNTSILIRSSAAGFTSRRIAALKRDQGAHNMNPLDMTTTLACISDLGLSSASILGVGGQYHKGHEPDIFRGVCLYQLEEDAAREPRWHFLKVLVDGHHSGSIERRSKCEGISEFDGQSSLVYFNHHFMLYTRANCAGQGHRQVQVCMGKTLSELNSFVLCSFSHICISDNIYFAHVYVCGHFLVAIAPIAFDISGGIYSYVSVDGINFTERTLLKSSLVHDYRTYDVPLSGATFQSGGVTFGILENSSSRIPKNSGRTEVFGHWKFDLRCILPNGYSVPEVLPPIENMEENETHEEVPLSASSMDLGASSSASITTIPSRTHPVFPPSQDY